MSKREGSAAFPFFVRHNVPISGYANAGEVT
jgi:hypothetical protein